jgi:hypothetical protein
MEMVLTFHLEKIRGEGRDRIGQFLIDGSYSTADGRCRWTKKYIGQHAVYYAGFNEGKGIWGTWHIGANHGGFHIKPEGMGASASPELEAAAEEPLKPPRDQLVPAD